MLEEQSYSDLADEDLMVKYLAGDARAFETVYERRREGLRWFFQRQCGSTMVAQELAQEVWFKLIRACQNEQYTVEAKFTTFLYRMGRNQLIDWYRSNGKIKTVQLLESDDEDGAEVEFEDEDARDPEQIYGDKEKVEAVLASIDELPEVQKQTLLMYVEGEMSYDEIAEAMNTKRETVKTRLRYARAALKKVVFEAS
jgi:RNA polymerase sigma-70 factor (ECF subfamily)